MANRETRDARALEARYRARSLWLDGLPGALEPRTAFAGDAEVDVAIVGAGVTGLWTAYYLAVHAPELRVAVLEREIAGYGASGRNGGWLSPGVAADPRVYARRHGEDAVRAAERLTAEGVDEVGRVVAEEGIDCGYRKGGQLMAATSQAQLERLRGWVAKRRQWGAGPEDLVELSPAEVAARVRVGEALGGAWSPHCAAIDPARLARGLAEAVERRGVAVYERSPVTAIEPGSVLTPRGRLRARHVLRATEAFTVQQPGERRRYLPLYSLMIATEPLPAEVWGELGWSHGECVADLRHLFFYAQRTPDDRLALGGRGAPYRLGSPIDEANERNDAVRARLVETVRRHFAPAAGARITHHWGGALAVPRDWSAGCALDADTGLGWGGGYSGHGVLAAHMTGRTLADLARGADTELTRLPWVGHAARRWEPEPLRFVASRAIVAVMGSADRAEEGLGRTARRMRLIAPFISGR